MESLKNMLIQCSILLDLIRRMYQIIFVTFFSFQKGLHTFNIKPLNHIYRQHHLGRWWKEALLIWNSVFTLNLNIYLCSYKTEAVIFLAWKNNYGSYLNVMFLSFWTSGQQYYKNWNRKINWKVYLEHI